MKKHTPEVSKNVATGAVQASSVAALVEGAEDARAEGLLERIAVLVALAAHRRGQRLDGVLGGAGPDGIVTLALNSAFWVAAPPSASRFRIA